MLKKALKWIGIAVWSVADRVVAHDDHSRRRAMIVPHLPGLAKSRSHLEAPPLAPALPGAAGEVRVEHPAWSPILALNGDRLVLLLLIGVHITTDRAALC